VGGLCFDWFFVVFFFRRGGVGGRFGGTWGVLFLVYLSCVNVWWGVGGRLDGVLLLVLRIWSPLDGHLLDDSRSSTRLLAGVSNILWVSF